MNILYFVNNKHSIYEEDYLSLKVLWNRFVFIVYNKVFILEHVFAICSFFSSRLYHTNIKFEI